MSSSWVQAVLGVAFGLVASLVLIRWVAPAGLLDRPDQSRKLHTHPTARTGGIVLWSVLVIGGLAGWVPFRLHAMDWAALNIMAFVGMLDDRYNLRARYKALVGLCVAASLGVHAAITMVGFVDHVHFLGVVIPSHPLVVAPVLMLWYWAVPQAYNLIDGVNGLSMGYAALLLMVLGWNLHAQSPILWGGLAAVLALNYPKARHFLGDAGALMLGTLFAILSVDAFALWDPDLLLWVFAYPTVDVCLVVSIRRWNGHALSRADRSHLHHWMMDRLKVRPWLVTLLLLGLASLPMMRATAIAGHTLISTLGLVILVFLALKAFLDRITEPAKSEIEAQVRREVPLMAASPVRDPSGSWPRT